MQHKKTYWLNVSFAIVWILLCLLSFATDIDYVEHTLTQKILTAVAQLFILAIPISTAMFLYKADNTLYKKLAFICNYCGLAISIFYLLSVAYHNVNAFFTSDLVIICSVYLFLTIPCFINVKALKAS